MAGGKDGGFTIQESIVRLRLRMEWPSVLPLLDAYISYAGRGLGFEVYPSTVFPFTVHHRLVWGVQAESNIPFAWPGGERGDPVVRCL